MMALEPEVCRPAQVRVAAVQEMHRARELDSVWFRVQEAGQPQAGAAARLRVAW